MVGFDLQFEDFQNGDEEDGLGLLAVPDELHDEFVGSENSMSIFVSFPFVVGFDDVPVGVLDELEILLREKDMGLLHWECEEIE